MPNHVTTIINFNNDENYDEIEKILEIIKTTEKDKDGKEHTTFIDFKKIIPMPENIYQGNLGAAEEEKYGKENCWYEWSIKHWGTKWNAYSTVASYSSIKFETAWNSPLIVIEKLSKMFPTTTLTVCYADEDIGSNLGAYKMLDGVKYVTIDFLTDLYKEMFAQAVNGVYL